MKRANTRHMIVMLAALALASACSNYAGTDEAIDGDSLALTRGSDPAAAFKAIYFGVGERKALSVLWQEDSRAARQRPEYLALVDTLTKSIDQRSPRFFATFNRGVTSGDPVLVEKAIQLGRVELESVLEKVHLPSTVGQDIWKTENIVHTNDVVYTTTRIVHKDLNLFDEPLEKDIAIEAIVEEFTFGI